MRFIYPALLERVGEGEVLVSFRDLPECRTSGESEAEALTEAQDALAEAIAGRIDDDEKVPVPSTQRDGEHYVAVPPGLAAKAALAIACQRSGQSLGALAKSLDINRQALSQMLDPRGTNDTDSISQALRILGSELVLEVRALASVPGE
jgi:antitoxin HicB